MVTAIVAVLLLAFGLIIFSLVHISSQISREEEERYLKEEFERMKRDDQYR